MTTLVSAALEVCAEIAVPVPVQGLFTYRIPAEWRGKAQIGVRVLVPFKNRETTGYLVAYRESQEISSLKSIAKVLDDTPVLTPELLALTRWISEYYGSSWGEAIENALPQWVKYGKKALRALSRKKEEEETTLADPLNFKLSSDQEKAFRKIQSSLKEPSPKPILLFGVTGSGKSEIYIRAIQEILAQGKSAICLVPEIALTEQIRRFFIHRFGETLEILHSKLSEGERFLAWNRLKEGEKKVVLGPRSAIFAPARKLGLVIIDEEHEGSYKQETAPRYHAREVARWRSRHENALLLLGTATPSLETMYQTQEGKIDRLDLKTRIEGRKMPQVQILDLKEVPWQRGKPAMLSPRLTAEMEMNLKKKEGTLLLLNRRGYSTHINCPQCGHIENCISCQVSLTFHQEDGSLLCHYCNYQKEVPRECAQCRSPLLKFAGFGTEKIESEVAMRFPHARVARMDADSVRKKGSHEIILKQFREHKIDILIGTQMIAKGFDFPHVTLVGVILADVGLTLPDFRSSERTFQLLTQVAGRAGRGALGGRVLIQTFSPRHPSVLCAKDHDYLRFFQHELEERRQYHYPPYYHLINIIVRSRYEKKAYQAARSVRDELQQQTASFTEVVPPVEIIGPAPLPFYRLRGHFRWHVMVKFQPRPQALNLLWQGLKKHSGVAIAVDVDPLNIL